MNNNLLSDFRKGDKKALARIITLVENETKKGMEIISELYSEGNVGYRIGITGPPGVGKSTTVNALLKELSLIDENIGIIAVDPSSPFTGGAMLGDRLRMNNSYDYENVFIRSVASRGSLGGLSAATENIAVLMERFGKNTLLIETVGVGQSELDIMEITDTVIVLLVPESGDSIQAMKAGIMEIGDIFVVNKADREGADRAVQYIKTVLSLNDKKGWIPPVIKITAKNNDNVNELVDSIKEHKNYLKTNKLLDKNRKSRKIEEVENLLRDMFIKNLKLNREKIIKSNESPYKIAMKIMNNIEKVDTEDLWKEK